MAKESSSGVFYFIFTTFFTFADLMCTLTYYPIPHGYIFTHNRDEKPIRASDQITTLKQYNYTITYPKDKGAEGTWLFYRSDGLAAFLLNGAFEKHSKREKYRLSRGLIMLDLAKSMDADVWLRQINLIDIEPFTLLVYNKDQLKEFVWDGSQKHIQPVSSHHPKMWCSATLYDPAVQLKRKILFDDWILKNPLAETASALLDLHMHGDIGDENNNLRMQRPDSTRTLSISQLIVQQRQLVFNHFNLPQDETLAENSIRSHNILTTL